MAEPEAARHVRASPRASQTGAPLLVLELDPELAGHVRDPRRRDLCTPTGAPLIRPHP
jgi:hypothetical protein